MICQASLEGIFRLIIIFFLVYVVFAALTRYVFPILLRNFMRNVGNRFTAENPDLFNSQDRKEGEVKINNIPDAPQKRKNAQDDEYIDYEEIKDQDIKSTKG